MINFREFALLSLIKSEHSINNYGQDAHANEIYSDNGRLPIIMFSQAFDIFIFDPTCMGLIFEPP